MSNIQVELFDGTRLEFPQGTSQDVIARTAKRLTLERQGKSSFDQMDENKQAVRRGANAVTQGYKDVLKETWNDPAQAARGWAGLAGDVAASIPGAGYGLIEGVKQGVRDRSLASGLEEFEKAVGSYLSRYSPSQLLDQEKLKKSNVYRVGGEALEVPETLVKKAGQGIGIMGDALVTGNIMTAGSGPVARELGAAGTLASSLAGGLYAGGVGRSPGRTAEGPSNAREAIAARQSTISTPTNLPMDVEMDQGRLPFPDAPRSQFGDPRLAQMPVDENGMPFDRSLTGQYGSGDTQQAVGFVDSINTAPDRRFLPPINETLGDSINSRTAVPTEGTQLGLFGNPQGAVETGLDTSARRGNTIDATVERLNSGEFSDVPVSRKEGLTFNFLANADTPAGQQVEMNFTGPTQPGDGTPSGVSTSYDRGLNYWESRLEDQNLIYDKAKNDQHTRRDMAEIGTLLTDINALDKERKDALVRLSDPNEYSSLEGDKQFQFQKINDAKELEIQAKVDKLDAIWNKLQKRMNAREAAPKTRDIYSTDPNAPRRAGDLTIEKTNRPDLSAPTDRPPGTVAGQRVGKNAGQGITYEGQELPPARRGAVAIGPRVPVKRSNPLSRFTDAFRRWFGDSKVVDAEGNPLEVYHGTSKDMDFKGFNAPRNGIWFTQIAETASKYAEENDSQGFTRDGWKLTPKNTASRVIPVYLSLKNPKVYDFWPDEFSFTPAGNVNYKTAQAKAIDELKRQGYDGAIVKSSGVYIAFNSNQVKSSRFNKGTWDGTKKDINKQGDVAGLSVKARRQLIQDSRITDAVLRGDLKGALVEAAAYGSTWQKAIARTLLSNLNSIGDLKIMSLSQVPDTMVKQEYAESPALYDPNTHTIVMGDIGEGQVARTLLHEVVHAYTHSYLSMARDRASGMGELASNPGLLRTAEKISDLYTIINQRHPELSKMYGMTDVHEFVSEAFSNAEFRAALEKIFVSEVSKKGTSYLVNAMSSMWNRVVGMLNSMGLNIDYRSKEGRNALQEILDLGEEVITKGKATDRAMYDRTFREHDGITYPLKRAAANGNLAEKVADITSKFNIDRRKLTDVIKDNGVTIENAREKVVDVNRTFVVGSKVMVDRAIATLSEGKGFVHDFIKNIVDRQQEIERKKRDGMESFSVGTNWAKNRFGFEERQKEGGILSALKKESISTEQAISMKNKWLEHVGGTRDLTRADFVNDAQWKAFSTIQTNLKRMWDQTNEARKKIGVEPVPYIRNYFPSQWEGDYRVFIRNQKGDLIDVRSADSRGQAKKMAAELQEEFGPDFTAKPDLASRSLRNVADLSTMDDILKALQNHPAEYAAVQRAYGRVAGKRGFGSTALQRKGVLGALGYEVGELGLRKMQKSLETYVNRQQSYVANIERHLLLNEIAGMPRSVAQHMQNSIKLMQDYLNEAKGRTEINFVDRGMELIGEGLGQGSGMATRLIHRGSRVASLFYLGTLNFLASQPLQPMFAYPRLYKMMLDGETTMRPERAFFGGYNNFLRAVTNNDPKLRDALTWARKNGYVEPALMQVMNDHMRDSAFRSTNKVGAAGDHVQTTFGLVTGWMEEWTVRAPTFFMFEHALSTTIKDPIKRYEAAGNMTDYYMVHYSQEALPSIYKQTGETIGELAKPLKQFTHNNYGQFLEYVKYAKDKDGIESVAPLIGFMMSTMLIAGAAGSMLTQFIDLFINMFNFATEKTGLRSRDDRISTFKDFVASTNFGDLITSDPVWQKKINDLITFGGPSAFTGYNFSGSVQSPSVTSLMEFPAVSFWGGMGKEAINYGEKALSGTATEGDEMRLLLATTPLAVRGMIEQMYSPDGSIIPNPKDDMRPLYRRDEGERAMALATGTRSTDEARYRQLVSAAKMFALSEREQRLAIMEKIYDGVRQGKPIDPQLIEKYAQAGGDVGNLTSNLITRMKTQDTTWAERQFQRGITPSSVNDRNTVQRYMENPRSP